MLNNENVWAKAMNRVINDKMSVDAAVDEMIARIKVVAGSLSPDEGSSPRGPLGVHRKVTPEGTRWPCRPARLAHRLGVSGACPGDTIVNTATITATPAPSRTEPLGMVGARDGRALPGGVRDLRALPGGLRPVVGARPENYTKLFADPIFLRTAINTIIFVVVAVNLKMMVALLLSGFFLHTRWWIKVLAVLFILPWAVPSIPTILSVRFMLNPDDAAGFGGAINGDGPSGFIKTAQLGGKAKVAVRKTRKSMRRVNTIHLRCRERWR